MKQQRFLFTALLVSHLLATAPVIAATSPENGQHDNRVKTILYQNDQVYKLGTHFGYSTVIEFGDEEHIETISLGDSKSWQVIKPARPNIVFIKPLAESGGTNMTILTNKHIYSFILSAARYDEGSQDATFRLTFKYPKIKEAAFAKHKENGEEQDPLSVAEKEGWNFDYDYAGARALKPEKIFDDGTFTYFRFDEGRPLPAIFAVDADGTERLVNYTVKGPYLVVTSVERQFTLRDGNTATCIFNQARATQSGVETAIVPVAPLKESDKTVSSVPLPPHKPSQSFFKLLFADFKGAETTSLNN